MIDASGRIRFFLFCFIALFLCFGGKHKDDAQTHDIKNLRKSLILCKQLEKLLHRCAKKKGEELFLCPSSDVDNENVDSIRRVGKMEIIKRKCRKREISYRKYCGCPQGGDYSSVTGAPEDTLSINRNSGKSDNGYDPNAEESQILVHLTCYLGDGARYRGQVSTTINNYTCANWLAQSPHAHTRTASNYPRSGLGDHNFCRNPDGEEMPWCYTTDANMRYDMCANIRRCPSNFDYDCQRGAGYSYRGRAMITVELDGLGCDVNQKKITATVNCLEGSGVSYNGNHSVSRGGLRCQKWKDSLSPSHFDVGDHNYCRNPNGLKSGPWCYVNPTDETHLGGAAKVNWEYCDVPVCEDEQTAGNQQETENTCRNSPHDDQMTGVWCFNPQGDKVLCDVPMCREISSAEETPDQSVYDCMWAEDLGRSYRGNINKTRGGIECQNWGEQNPHSHSIFLDTEKGIGNHNFCRNPDGEPGPWCYTKDPNVRWNFCAIPPCFKDNEFVTDLFEIIMN